VLATSHDFAEPSAASDIAIDLIAGRDLSKIYTCAASIAELEAAQASTRDTLSPMPNFSYS
jgi:hypothetical protein